MGDYYDQHPFLVFVRVTVLTGGDPEQRAADCTQWGSGKCRVYQIQLLTVGVGAFAYPPQLEGVRVIVTGSLGGDNLFVV